MAAQKKQSQGRVTVNLLYPQGIPQKIYLRFVKWLISYGRFIVIFVELIVIGAFVYRFKLDSELEDINKKINSQIPLIEALRAEEITIKRAQSKLSSIKNNFNISPDWSDMFSQISDQVSPGTLLQGLYLTPTAEGMWQFRIIGNSLSNNDLALLLGGLKKNKELQNINLLSIGFDKNKLLFSISGDFLTKTASSSGALQ